jgi:hypothetical protein
MRVTLAVVVTALVTAGGTFAASTRYVVVRPGDGITTANLKLACAVIQTSGSQAITCGRVRDAAHAYTATASPEGVAVSRGGRIVFVRTNP